MQFTSFVIAAAAIVGASAQVSLTDNSFAGISVGTPFEVTWGDASGSVALVLVEGNPLNFNTISTITTGLAVPTGSFSWTPDTALAPGNYAIEVQDSVTSNFGNLFQLLSATASPTFSSAVSASTTSSGSSSTTSGSSSSTSSSGSSSVTKTSSTSSTASKTGTTTSSSSPSSTSPPPKTNSASGLASPLALVLVSFAAFALFN